MNTLRNTVFNVETAPSAHNRVKNNIFFYSECVFDVFVGRELVIVDFHVFFCVKFQEEVEVILINFMLDSPLTTPPNVE